MAIYPIKMVKDENGQPFIPLTHISAVAGEEYITAVLTAFKQSKSRYKINNDKISMKDINNGIIAVRFDIIDVYDEVSYLSINNETYYPIHKDGDPVPLNIGTVKNLTCLLQFNDGKWNLINKSEGGSSSTGGHTILDENGNVMTERQVMQFKGLDVTDDISNAATVITNKPNGLIHFKSIDSKTLTNSTWINIASNIDLPKSGYYEFKVHIIGNNLSKVGKEIGIKVNSNNTTTYDWYYQYKRLDHTYLLQGNFNAGEKANIDIYVDPLSSTEATSITSGYITVEYLGGVNND